MSTVDEARQAVDDYVKMKPEFINIWVDDRGGTKGRPLAKKTPREVEQARKDFEFQASNAMKLRAAGMRTVSGAATGQTRFFIG